MRCDWIIRRKAGQRRGHLDRCNAPAEMYSVQGGFCAVKLWRCREHYKALKREAQAKGLTLQVVRS